jgi:hypothetical protein
MSNPEFKAAFMQQIIPYLKSTVMKPIETTDGNYIAADDILNTPGIFDV